MPARLLSESVGTDEPPQRRAIFGVLQWAVWVLPVAFLAGIGWANRLIVDDGFIYLRVVRQVVDGNGPVYNTGERVEAFTSPLWVAVLSLGDVVTPLRLEWLAIVLGIGLSVLGAVAAIAGAARLARAVEPQSSSYPPEPSCSQHSSRCGTSNPAGWRPASRSCGWGCAHGFSPSGRLVAAGVRAFGRGARTRLARRPELLLDSLVFVGIVAILQWRHSGRRRRLLLLVSSFAVPVAYQLFRMSYYGALVANTAIAKEGSRVRPHAGFNYLMDFVRPYWLWIPSRCSCSACIYRWLGSSHAATRLARSACSSRRARGNPECISGRCERWRLHPWPLAVACAVPRSALRSRLYQPRARYLATVAIVTWAFICAITLRPPQIGSERPLRVLRRGCGLVATPEYRRHAVGHSLEPRPTAAEHVRRR